MRLNISFVPLAMLVCSVAAIMPPAETSPVSIGEFVEEIGLFQSIRLTKDPPLLRKQSKFQMIEILKSAHYGKVLVLDGVMQLTERDADAYNEMMAHIPMFQHKKPKRVLIIGGGDGYVLSEVLKHESVEHVDHVDLDGEVVDACKEHFSWGAAWNDPRVNLHVADGSAFVRNAVDQSYDVIIQDSSDPWTWDENGEQIPLPSNVLYSPEHFSHLQRILCPNGILNLQAECLQIPADLEGIAQWRKLALDVGFQNARYSSITISSYPSGQIGLLLCEKNSSAASTLSHLKDRFVRMSNADMSTSYYHPRLQTSSFDLPLWAEKRIYDDAVPMDACDSSHQTAETTMQ